MNHLFNSKRLSASSDCSAATSATEATQNSFSSASTNSKSFSEKFAGGLFSTFAGLGGKSYGSSSAIHSSPASSAHCDSSNHLSSSKSNESDEDEDEKNCKYFVTDTFFLREEAENAMSNSMASRSQKSYSRAKLKESTNETTATTPLLGSIPETEDISMPVDERNVKLVTFLDGYDDSCDPEAIANSIHLSISNDVHFTCMKNVPKLLKEAFRQTSKNLDASARISCITLVIYKSEVCMAHVGESRAIIVAPNSLPIQLNEEQMDIYTRELTGYLGQSECNPEILYFQISNQELQIQSPSKPKSLTSRISRAISKKPKQHPVFLVIANAPVWESMSNIKVANVISKALIKNQALQKISKSMITKYVNPRKSRFADAEAMIMTF